MVTGPPVDLHFLKLIHRLSVTMTLIHDNCASRLHYAW